MDPVLLRKYNVPGPRYTSYPAVPHWTDAPSRNTWEDHVTVAFDRSNAAQGISLYIHLPYCDSLCTYCGCTTRITVNHGVEGPYINAVLNEWRLYKDLFKGVPRIRELHLGGGTPTFFSPQQLARLVNGLLEGCELTPDAELSFEGHPRSTSKEHLLTLHDLGFRRVSIGIQDFDPRVQVVINRVQPFAEVQRVFDDARQIGYGSINADLIYGLPLQTERSIRLTMGRTLALRPDRIAFYSYAHVPWIKPGQRRYTEADLPAEAKKRALYELGRALLEEAGYEEVGMDHFALPGEALHTSMRNGTLHRNFMGYTPVRTELLLGLGVSSISDAWTAYAQNLKVVEDYLNSLGRNELPIFRGHVLSEQDLVVRELILDLMCRSTTDLKRLGWDRDRVKQELAALASDGIVILEGTNVRITDEGHPCVRNVCMAIDPRMGQQGRGGPVFSRTI
ncbi:MAG: oxygen-independent coproporphyrinogen III oxidase [Flavobacteriales bacterium]|nr:oxygen-independent coproporphyrinogen III oxidase [Flavobacteriales bacterium]